MEFIAPKERFSTHANSIMVPEALVRSAAQRLQGDVLTITALSGGFMNANFLVRSSQGKCVYRVYATDRTTAERELDILRYIEGFHILAPRAHDLIEMDGRWIGVISYIEGTTLEDALLAGAIQSPKIFFEMGRHLAAIHAIVFAQAGFIGPKLSIGSEFDQFGSFIKGFVQSTLERLPETRLERQTCQRLLRLVDEKWDIVVPSAPLRQLVHCDFNPKNIMVTQAGALAAILDWEFCLAGDGLIDLANFFRFSYDFPEGSEASFAAGYRAAGGNLAPNWREAGLLLDLGNMCSFLERREDYQRSFRTARVVIQATLAHFGY